MRCVMVRTNISGLVSAPFTRAMMRLRSSGVNVSVMRDREEIRSEPRGVSSIQRFQVLVGEIADPFILKHVERSHPLHMQGVEGP
jgi:hypothetical protein